MRDRSLEAQRLVASTVGSKSLATPRFWKFAPPNIWPFDIIIIIKLRCAIFFYAIYSLTLFKLISVTKFIAG